jgi:site-specific DNA recombinase
VHALIKGSPHTKKTRQLGRTPALLKGLLFGPGGTAMTPSHTRKRGRLYRYYTSTDALKRAVANSALRRIPAAEIEAVVVAQIKTMLQSPEIVVATWRAAGQSIKGLSERTVREELFRFEELWNELFPAEQARIVQLLVERVDISETGADIRLRVDGLSTVLNDLRTGREREAA